MHAHCCICPHAHCHTHTCVHTSTQASPRWAQTVSPGPPWGNPGPRDQSHPVSSPWTHRLLGVGDPPCDVWPTQSPTAQVKCVSSMKWATVGAYQRTVFGDVWYCKGDVCAWIWLVTFIFRLGSWGKHLEIDYTQNNTFNITLSNHIQVIASVGANARWMETKCSVQFGWIPTKYPYVWQVAMWRP